jgi:OOP family OmpA-OmpF porin
MSLRIFGEVARQFLVLAAVTLMAAPSLAQREDVEGAKDHPSFTRMPGFVIANYSYQEFSSYTFYHTDPPKTVEGEFWSIEYQVNEGLRYPGPLQIARNYTNLMRKNGGVALSEDMNPSGGRAVARMPAKGGGNLWLEVAVSNSGEYYTLTVVREAAMAQEVAFTAESLARELAAGGPVAIRSILFDTGKATIQASSAEVLGVIAEMLRTNPEMKLEISGHTDNVGQAAANLELSRARAAAVKNYLVSKGGIVGARLTTAGFGATKPVADNTTDEGRAANRRVELVKK